MIIFHSVSSQNAPATIMQPDTIIHYVIDLTEASTRIKKIITFIGSHSIYQEQECKGDCQWAACSSSVHRISEYSALYLLTKLCDNIPH